MRYVVNSRLPVLDETLIADPARTQLLGYESHRDRTRDLTRQAVLSIHEDLRFALLHPVPSAAEDSIPVQKIVLLDRPAALTLLHMCAIFFAWGSAGELNRLYGPLGGVRTSRKFHDDVHLWVLGVRDATDDEIEAFVRRKHRFFRP